MGIHPSSLSIYLSIESDSVSPGNLLSAIFYPYFLLNHHFLHVHPQRFSFLRLLHLRLNFFFIRVEPSKPLQIHLPLSTSLSRSIPSIYSKLPISNLSIYRSSYLSPPIYLTLSIETHVHLSLSLSVFELRIYLSVSSICPSLRLHVLYLLIYQSTYIPRSLSLFFSCSKEVHIHPEYLSYREVHERSREKKREGRRRRAILSTYLIAWGWNWLSRVRTR